jgi:hypothetical protein
MIAKVYCDECFKRCEDEYFEYDYEETGEPKQFCYDCALKKNVI